MQLFLLYFFGPGFPVYYKRYFFLTFRMYQQHSMEGTVSQNFDLLFYVKKRETYCYSLHIVFLDYLK